MNVILVALLVYLVFVLLLFIFQSHLLYFPGHTLVATPRDVGLPFTDVVFSAADGTKLAGWFVPAGNARGVIFFCHGNGGNMSYLLETILQYHRLGFDTFLFDYRGYGRSEGSPSEQGTYLDAEGAWTYLLKERGIPPSRIILVGRSLGGAVAAWLAQKVTPGALVIESAFTSVPDIAASAYRFFPARLLTRFRYCTREYFRHITCPILIVHSPDDEIIPFSHGRQLFEAAHEPKEFLQIRGGHNDAFALSEESYQRGLTAFLARHTSL